MTERFLTKILTVLVSARVLVSLRGPYGGYRLDRRPEDVTVLEVIEAIDGPIRGAAPPPEPPSRRYPRYDRADAEWTYEVLNELCMAAADEMRQSLRAVTLADLLEGQPNRDQEPVEEE
jgi:Rrf2 family protein